jgi:hypothetical protein
VVVGSVLALLFVVMAVTASGLKWGSAGHHAKHSTATSTTARRSGLAAALGERSSTTVIVGATTLFVTTTVPLTTTTSTTTTTTLPRKSGLQVRGGPLVLSPGSDGQVIVVNISKKAFTWNAESSLTGLAVQPATGRLRAGGSQEVSVVAAGKVKSGAHGVITFTSSAGDSQSVDVSVKSASPSSAISVSAPAIIPNQPDCSQPVVVVVRVSGGRATSVVLNVHSPSGLGSIGFSPAGGGRWLATIPPQPGGTSVSGTITAQAADGTTAQTSLQYGVSHHGPC